MDEPQSLDFKLIQKLVRIMTRAELSELEIDDTARGLRVHLRRGAGDQGSAPLVHVMQGGALPAAPVPAVQGAAPAPAIEPAEAPVDTVPFTSQMVGTFYRAPSPDSDPFCEVGTVVDEDSVICIIEAMKVMNEIKAEMKGEIARVLVESGEPIEFGQPLFLIRAN